MAYQNLLDSLLNCLRIDTASGNVSVYGSLQQGSVKSSLLAANSDGVLVAATGVSDFIKVGINNFTATGTPSATTFLRGDNTWATITSLSGSYQPLDSDLTAIAGLADSSGFLKKVDATPTWQIDTAEYMTIAASDLRYQALSGRKDSITTNSTAWYYSVTAVNAGLATKMSSTGGTMTGDLTLQYSYPSLIFNDTSSGGVYRFMVDGGQFYLKYGTTTLTTLITSNSSGAITFASNITAGVVTGTSIVKSGGTAAQFLKANGTVDSTSYQPLDADLTAIAALADSSGLLRKIDATPSWAIDTAEYMTITTSDARYQVLSGRKDSIVANNTSFYYSVTAVNNALATKMGVAGGTFTGDLNIQSSYPSVILNDTSSGGIYRIVSDGGQFFLRYGSGTGITSIVTINSSGTISANGFVKSGGTSAQFLKADGSVSTNPGWITGISGADVITALGYTPYRDSNPAGYITSSYITNANIISALGYTPYNATNPNSYISLTEANGLYLKLTGGTLSGSLTATAFYESSDKNLKTLIATDYKAKGIESIVSRLYIKNGKEELGYFAQDVESILPSAVFIGADGYLSLSYREVHTAKIAYLEREVAELKAQLARL
jgi:hypothetical protein